MGHEAYSRYSNRPAALYSRWIGGEVPNDVTELEGGYKFYLTESVMWLKFYAPQARLDDIVTTLQMKEVRPEVAWSQKVDSRKVSWSGHESYTNWFELSGWDNQTSLPSDLVVYWVSMNDDNFSSGWVLYYSPSSKRVVLDYRSI